MTIDIKKAFCVGITSMGLWVIAKIIQAYGYQQGWNAGVDKTFEYLDDICMEVDPEAWSNLTYKVNVHNMLDQANNIIVSADKD